MQELGVFHVMADIGRFGYEWVRDIVMLGCVGNPLEISTSTDPNFPLRLSHLTPLPLIERLV
jgi:hypothetical protein